MARILVVDDSFIVQRTMGLLLRRLGHEVSTVGNGREALGILSERLFDLALVDMSMPLMGGLELVTTLRERHHAEQMRVVFLTASSTEEDRVAAEQLNIDGFLNKPVSSYQLQEMINNVLP